MINEHPGWRFRAHTTDGQVRTGTLQAASAEEVRRLLAAKNMIPDEVRPAPKDRTFQLRRTPGHKAVTVYTRQFATLVDSGIPLVLGLDILESITDDIPLRRATQGVSRAVQSGATLADAMRNHPKVFPPLYIYMVEAGEEGGHLDTTFEQLAEYLEKSQLLRERVRAALAYPALITFVAGGAILAMLTLVVPAFVEMFAAADVALPVPTQMLVDASDYIQAQWQMLLLGTAMTVLVLQQIHDSSRGRILFDGVLLIVPVIGGLVRKASVARFTRTMASLLYSGVAILDAVRVSARTAGNEVISRSVMKSYHGIAAGRGISAPLAESKVLPKLVAQMVRVGEETGQLDLMFAKVANFYEAEVDVTVEGLVKALEPAMVVIVGVVLGGMVVAMYLPILEAITVVG